MAVANADLEENHDQGQNDDLDHHLIETRIKIMVMVIKAKMTTRVKMMTLSITLIETRIKNMVRAIKAKKFRG